MNDLKYKRVLYVIVIVIIGTVGIQAYWNYKNYLVNKQQLVNDVQASLDRAIDEYYANLAEKNTIGFAIEANSHEEFFMEDGKFDSILNEAGFSDKNFNEFKKISKDTISGVRVFQGIKVDSILEDFHVKQKITFKDSAKSSAKWLKKKLTDSSANNHFEMLTSKVVISMTNDSVSLKKIDTLLKAELNRKNILVNYGLTLDVEGNKKEELNGDLITASILKAVSKSPFLPNDNQLTIHFSNEVKIIFKRIFVGLIVSTLLVLAVIICLFYLLKIIKHQKQLSEVKNDLISNITHEFKTPISTISVALESIKSFNDVEQNERANRYLNMSTNQLSKLNLMVEKLLETATLDSDRLVLDKKKVNITGLLKTVVEKFKVSNQLKDIKFISSSDEILVNIDLFHFENAINNIVDNAVKYGGDKIIVTLSTTAKNILINVSDNGTSLEKQHREKLFEQFYRVPKGNRHDVKGFGIGLYYTKKIIEKHNGTVQLELQKKHTIFKIALPNG